MDKKEWDEIKKLFDNVIEWYKNRHIYHRIGFILEYNPQKYNIKTLASFLANLKHSQRTKELDSIIKNMVSNIKSESLFYGKKKLSEILFLYNILLEDRRHNNSARFSFADYKQVRTNIGWDQEHIASNQDYEPNEREQKELASDLIELITGNKPKVKETPADLEDTIDQKQVKDKQPSFVYELNLEQGLLNQSEKELCEQLLNILNQTDNQKLSQQELEAIYNTIFLHFNRNKDPLRDHFDSMKNKKEKDFIWNFVLLNSKTNRSYGNHIFAVKRRRILADEFNVYTPVGTRNVFEKVYSSKIEQVLTWTRSDAKTYWADIKRVLRPYVELKDIE